MARPDSIQKIYKSCRSQLSAQGRQFADEMVKATKAGDFQTVDQMWQHDIMEDSFTPNVEQVWEVWHGQMWDDFVLDDAIVQECVAHGLLVAEDVQTIRKYAA